jgi:hypothetical protein
MSRHLSSLPRPAVLVSALILSLWSVGALAQTPPAAYEVALPSLNPELSPLAEENLPILADRLMLAFGRDYGAYLVDHVDRDLHEGMAVYYLRQELQAFIDMWRATGKSAYLDQAKNLTLQAIQEATAQSQPLLWHGEYRGLWPCFYLESVQAQTGGHNQLADFQGSAGFLMVARALQQINEPEWKDIADFVERQVVTKWLFYKPSITPEQLTGPQSNRYILTVLNGARDVREHFAGICLDLNQLGYRDYLYWQWGKLLVDLYLTPRYDPNEAAPHQDEVLDRVPGNWGLFVHTTPEGYTWLSVPNYDPNKLGEPMDTSHSNRTVWLAARACSEGLVDLDVVEGLVNTLRYEIWAPEKGPFYFNNYVDGSDGEVDGLGHGRAGNVWFGWHRLAPYDEELTTLFLSMAYDLTNGGENLPEGAQNKKMVNAATCLEAWATRLLAARGQPLVFP